LGLRFTIYTFNLPLCGGLVWFYDALLLPNLSGKWPGPAIFGFVASGYRAKPSQ